MPDLLQWVDEGIEAGSKQKASQRRRAASDYLVVKPISQEKSAHHHQPEYPIMRQTAGVLEIRQQGDVHTDSTYIAPAPNSPSRGGRTGTMRP